MPTYTFKCDKCGKIDSAYLPMTHVDGGLVCKKCSKPMRRYFGSMPPVVFIGSGFYVNDSKIDNK